MRTSKRDKFAGFTVVELMVALTVGGIAVSSLYAVGAASMRHYREQQRVSTTQSALRAAMNQIKRDFARAGFLATPNVDMVPENCSRIGSPLNQTTAAPGSGRLAGISAYFKNVTRPSDLDPNNLNAWATVDDVTLMGNFATSGEYQGVTPDATRKVMTFPTTSQSFQRDFTYWYAEGGAAAGACNPTALATAFPPNRLVRIRTRSDRSLYAQVDSSTCNSPAPTAQITLKGAAPSSCTLELGWIAPINAIRYYADNARDANEKSRIGDNRVVILRRVEVDPGAQANPLKVTDASGTTTDADNRAVLDYVVRFNVDFLMRDATTRRVDLVPATVTQVQTNPEWVRTAIIELAARTSEHEPDMQASAVTSRVRPFRVLTTRGAARTRALRAEIFMPNIAYKGY